MMPITRFGAICALTASLAAAADPELLNLVMPGVRVLAGVNVDSVEVSPFGQYLLSRLEAHPAMLQEWIDTTGFDPRRDAREILVASDGQADSARRLTGLVLVRGDFDVALITGAATAKGAVAEEYKGATLLSGPRKRGVLALAGSTLALAGQADVVRAALDRRTAPAALDPALAARVAALSASEHAWLVSTVLPPRLPALYQGLLSHVQQSSLGLRFGADVSLSGELLADSEQNAGALAELLRLIAAMGQSSAPLGEALKTLQVSVAGRTVTFSVQVPESQLEQLIKGR